MKKLLTPVLLYILCLSTTFAQNNLPLAYEIKTDTTAITTLPRGYWQLLPDKNGIWTINDVSKALPANNFYFRNAAPKNADTISKTYWFRYRLKNAMRMEAKVSI